MMRTSESGHETTSSLIFCESAPEHIRGSHWFPDRVRSRYHQPYLWQR
jgi:hypothetical protein